MFALINHSRLQPRRGASLTEWGLVAVLIILVAIGALAALGVQVNALFDQAATLNGSSGSEGPSAEPSPSEAPAYEEVVTADLPSHYLRLGDSSAGAAGYAAAVMADDPVRYFRFGDANSPAADAYAAAVMADSPLQYYRFEETSGSAAADAMGGPAGTRSGATIDVEGAFYDASGAYSFDSSDYVTIGTPLGTVLTGDFTFET